MSPADEITALKERIERLERTIIFGAPPTIAAEVAFEALERGDKKTFALYHEQQRKQRGASFGQPKLNQIGCASP